MSNAELTVLCHLGQPAGEVCAYQHVASVFPRGKQGGKNYRLCPVHGGREASISINPGHSYRVVFNEKYDRCELDAADIRAELLKAGAHESCLGSYGAPKRTVVPGLRVHAADMATVADAKRWQAVAKLPFDLAGHLYKMCVQAILDGDGDEPGDPFRLLPDSREDFIDLGLRCGYDRSYCRKLWAQWSGELQSIRSLPA